MVNNNDKFKGNLMCWLLPIFQSSHSLLETLIFHYVMDTTVLPFYIKLPYGSLSQEYVKNTISQNENWTTPWRKERR